MFLLRLNLTGVTKLYGGCLEKQDQFSGEVLSSLGEPRIMSSGSYQPVL